MCFSAELDQDKILRFSGSMVRPRVRSCPEHEKKGSWKCAPRKKTLLGSADKMLSISDFFSLSTSQSVQSIQVYLLNPHLSDDFCIEGDNRFRVDWSCNDMLAVANSDRLNIYDNNGEKLLSYKADLHSDFNKIFDIKWSDDGEYNIEHGKRIALTVITSNNLTPGGV